MPPSPSHHSSFTSQMVVFVCLGHIAIVEKRTFKKMKLFTSLSILGTLLGVANASDPVWFRLKQCACSDNDNSRDDNPVDCEIKDDATGVDASCSSTDTKCFCLGLREQGNPLSNDNRLWLEPCDPGDDNQKFYYESFGDLSDHRIFAYDPDEEEPSGFCVRCTEKSRGASIRLQSCGSSSKQKWRHTPGDDHWAAIRVDEASQYCITYQGEHLNAGDNAKLYTEYCPTDGGIGVEPSLLFEQVDLDGASDGCAPF